MLKQKSDSRFSDLLTLLERDIRVSHISSELQAVDGYLDSSELKEHLLDKDFDVIGVRRENSIIGYVNREDLVGGYCEEYLIRFGPSEVVSEATSILDVLYMFEEKERVFVLEKNQVNGIVAKADLQKPPVSMLFFGLISLLESFVTELIQKHYPGQEWHPLIPEEKLKAAKERHSSKEKDNEALDLLDYLYFIDKLNIVINIKSVATLFEIESKTKAQRMFDKINTLRNTVVHGRNLDYELSLKSTISTMKQVEFLLHKSEESLRD